MRVLVRPHLVVAAFALASSAPFFDVFDGGQIANALDTNMPTTKTARPFRIFI